MAAGRELDGSKSSGPVFATEAANWIRDVIAQEVELALNQREEQPS